MIVSSLPKNTLPSDQVDLVKCCEKIFADSLKPSIVSPKSNIKNVTVIRTFNSLVVDGVAVMLLILSCGRELIIHLSSRYSPQAVYTSYYQAKRISEVLGGLSRYIHLPLNVGVVDGLSYSVSERLFDLHSENFFGRLRRRLVGHCVANWVTEAALASKRKITKNEAAIIDKLVSNLIAANLILEGVLPFGLIENRWAADDVYGFVDHGDLWSGNVLLRRPNSVFDFRVIDWGGASLSGFGFSDLLSVFSSFGFSDVEMSFWYRRYIYVLRLNHKMSIYQYLCSAAMIYSSLGSFPLERFREKFNNDLSILIRLNGGS